MRKILFVDDEQNILDGLRRSFRSMRDEWEMRFANSGQDALSILENEECDIIVSDMRMPGMDGIELLSRVKEKYPTVIRFILSGFSDKQMILRSVPLAHQYLSKPCDAQTLKSTIDHTLQLQNLFKDEKLKDLVSLLESIPTLPTLYNELQKELLNPDSTIENISRIIEKDVGMTAKILQLINSAFFGLKREITTTEEAVNYLGLDIIRSLVLSIEVFEKYKHSTNKWFNMERLMNHSLTCANYAKIIAKDVKMEKVLIGNSFMGGILHDIGKLLLVANLPKEYEQVAELVSNKNARFFEAERLAFGASHARIGAYLLGLWGFPNNILEAVAFHHDPNTSARHSVSPLLAVHVANGLCHKFDGDVEDEASIIDEAYLKELGLTGKVERWEKLCCG